MTLQTVINDLSELVVAEVRVAGRPDVLQNVKLAPSSSHTFSLGPIGVDLVLIKGGPPVSVPIGRENEVIYTSDFFPPRLLQTIINDSTESVVAEVRVVGTSSIVQSVQIAPSSSHTFSLGPIGVNLVVIKGGREVTIPIKRVDQVIYVSKIFPTKNLQTVINDFKESIEAEVRIVTFPPPPPNKHVIPPSSSFTFALGPIGVDLVVIAKIDGKIVESNFPINLDGGEQAKYASELFKV